MANKGIAFERTVKNELIAQGFNAIRSSASSSPVDVYAWAPNGEEYWIQCKSSVHGMRPAEWNAFLSFCRFYKKTPILATRIKNGRRLETAYFLIEDFKSGNGERQPMKRIKIIKEND